MSSTPSTQTNADAILISEVELLAIRQRRVILTCKQFLEQLKNKGIVLTFTERTACNLILESIERLGYK